MTLNRAAFLNDPSGANVAVVGAGVSGLAAAELLLHLGARVTLCDDRDLSAIDLSAHPRVVAEARLAAGGLEAAALSTSDAILLSPGVPRTRPEVFSAIETGCAVFNEVELGAAHTDMKACVGITGTNGKSTTTAMLGAIFEAAGLSAVCSGNFGRPLCEVALADSGPKAVVLELSSYQLETIQTLALDAAVITNMAPDHLDRYENVESYYAAKASIVGLLAADARLITDPDDATTQAALSSVSSSVERFDFNGAGPRSVRVEGRTLVIEDEGESSIEIRNAAIVGPHNVRNAAAAVAAATCCSLDVDACERGLNEYPGIAHRLERLGVDGAGVSWFNDSKATNVDAACVAVASFESGIHLLLGGVGKGASYGPLAEMCEGRTQGVYVFGQDKEAIVTAFSSFGPESFSSLDEAVGAARASATSGDVILLSPACASFDQFENFVVRGNAFRALFAMARGK